MSRRFISHTEISKALECMASWDFAYGGHLTGGQVLKPKIQHVRLREGKAWGRAIAALHDGGGPLHVSYGRALAALHSSLEHDADRQREHGVYDHQAHHDAYLRLAAVLWHYASTTDPIALTDPEVELRVPIPSRSGRGVSNRYALHAFLDGLTVIDGRLWIVEYKLRDRLTDYAQIVLGRQYRRYAWAAERVLGEQIAGIIVDERLNEAPKPARWVRGRKKGEGMVPSHAKDQLTTSELYLHACDEAGVAPDQETAAALKARRWQVRHPPVLFLRSEIEEAGRELVAAAQLIAQLDAGHLHPIRNPSPRRCPGCAFTDVCAHPQDRELVGLHFDLRPPKRDLPPVEAGTS